MAKPKVSLGSWAFSFGPFADHPWPFVEVAKYAANAGYDGIEINGILPHPHPDQYNSSEKCQELLGILKNLGLGISAYSPDLTAVPPEICECKEYLEALKKSIFFCEKCEIKLLRVDTGLPPEEKNPEVYQRQFQRLVLNWQAAAEEAKKSGITIVWEFEPGFWLNKPSEVKSLADRINRDNFKLLFDTSHAYMGSVIGARHTSEKEMLKGGLNEYAEMLLSRIGHIHLIDSNGKLHNNDTSVHESFGKGFIDFRSVMYVLAPVVSRLDWVCVDYCFNPDTPVEAKEASKFVKALLNEVLK